MALILMIAYNTSIHTISWDFFKSVTTSWEREGGRGEGRRGKMNSFIKIYLDKKNSLFYRTISSLHQSVCVNQRIGLRMHVYVFVGTCM